MKNIINIRQLEAVIADIIHEREESAKSRGETFEGVPEVELANELERRLGKGWKVKREQPFKLTKEDITAVANSRFYRKTGIKILMGWAIVVLGILILGLTLKVIHVNLMYGLTTAACFAFVFIYSRKQRQTRREIFREIEGVDFGEQK